jgi:hypothetical protein
MAERDANQEALRQVEEATDSEPAQTDELLASPKLREQLREAEEELRQSEKK